MKLMLIAFYDFNDSLRVTRFALEWMVARTLSIKAFGTKPQKKNIKTIKFMHLKSQNHFN